jgi:hypothetical protein
MNPPKIDPEFKSFIPPLSEAERADLRASIKKAGRARDPIKTWSGLIVDGHNRFEICQELWPDQPKRYTTEEMDLPDRAAVKAWMFEHQIARRNLTVDQIVMLAALRGLGTTRGSPVTRREAAALVNAGFDCASVIRGEKTIFKLHREHFPPKPRAPRGPSTKPHIIPEGHELKGLTTLKNAEGETIHSYEKTQIAGQDDPVVPPLALVSKVSTLYGPDGTVRAQWVGTKPEEVERWEAGRSRARTTRNSTPRWPQCPRPRRARTRTCYRCTRSAIRTSACWRGSQRPASTSI